MPVNARPCVVFPVTLMHGEVMFVVTLLARNNGGSAAELANSRHTREATRSRRG